MLRFSIIQIDKQITMTRMFKRLSDPRCSTDSFGDPQCCHAHLRGIGSAGGGLIVSRTCLT